MTDSESDRKRSFRHPPENPGASAARWVQRNDTRLERVIDLLEANLGNVVQPGKRNALQVLVLTILSQNTTDPNALQAYEHLMEAFPPEDYDRPDTLELPRDEEGNIDSVEIRMSQVADTLPSPDWEKVRQAPGADLAEAISVCGLQSSKSSAIQRALDWLYEENEGFFELEGLLEGKSAEEALDMLSSIKGIGTKTAAVTLMEATGVDLCPVDTHVHRVATRLHLVDPDSSRNQTFRDLHNILPEGKGFSLHHNLLTFGRTICTARDPDCEHCFLSRICPFYRIEQNGEDLVLKEADE